MQANNQYAIDAVYVQEQRAAMQDGMFLYTNGRRHDVILDDGIAELDPADGHGIIPGQYASDIYLVPRTYLGNRPATYFEFKDYRGATADAAQLRGNEIWWTDGGRFMWVVEQTKWCYTLSAKIEPRIILKTPQLAGRLQHVKYEPLQHLRAADESSSYFYKGGVSMRTPSTLYSDWNLPQ